MSVGIIQNIPKEDLEASHNIYIGKEGTPVIYLSFPAPSIEETQATIDTLIRLYNFENVDVQISCSVPVEEDGQYRMYVLTMFRKLGYFEEFTKENKLTEVEMPPNAIGCPRTDAED
jgi:hypothetical protein